MSPSRALAPALALAVLLTAPAFGSTASNTNDPNGRLTLTPTAAGETNTLTIAYTDATSAPTPSGYTVHDASTAITIDVTCTGCNQIDANTVFVSAAQGVTVTTGNGDSSVAITGQGPLGTTTTNTITGGTGKDTLTGGHVTNFIDGGLGDDTISGGANNDVLTGNAGNDILSGGAGGDVFPTTDGDDDDTINGGPGIDQIPYQTKASAIHVTEDGVANDGTSGEKDNVGGIESIVGTPYDDVISTSGTTSGGTITGGIGNDTLTGSSARETINGNAGNDTIQGAGGSDQLNGGAGNDTIGGGAGNDTVDGGDGNDTADGGVGNDTFSGIIDDDGADAYTGGTGDDSISYASKSGPVSITEDGVANDGAADEGDNVAADIEGITGSPDADTIVGSAASNQINGNGGADTIDGGAGTDVIQVNGDGSNTSLKGGDGNDVIVGGDGDDTIDGGTGDDLVLGGTGGADDLSGGPGTDSVSFINVFFFGGVTVSLDGVANDGRSGQNVNVRPDIENVTGSFGADTITGAPGVRNRIDGAGGGDTINVASSPADRDTVLCRSTVGIGVARGFGVAGGQNDDVTADELDQVSNEGATGCGTIHRPPRGPRARILTGSAHPPGRVFTVSFHCLSAHPRCRIDAQLESVNGTVLDHGHITITSGKQGQLLFHLSRTRRMQLDAGKTLKERVTAEVRDESGVTTSAARTITLKGG